MTCHDLQAEFSKKRSQIRVLETRFANENLNSNSDYFHWLRVAGGFLSYDIFLDGTAAIRWDVGGCAFLCHLTAVDAS